VSQDDSLYDNLPDDPEEAFLYLESVFRAECEQKIGDAHHEERVDIYYIQYISKVLGAISELGIESHFAKRSIPSIEDVDYQTYVNFSKDVEHYRTMLQIRRARRRKEFSVALDQATKIKLRHMLSQMRDIVDRLDVSAIKKEALFAKINALQAEIDRDRARFDIVAALWIEGCEKLGEGAGKLKPLRELLDSIGNVFNQAKKVEGTDTPRLPPVEKPKQIEPPKPTSDDIPF
jgi:hypothetical protein